MPKRRARVRHDPKGVKPPKSRRKAAAGPRVLVVGPNSAIDEVFRTRGFCPLGGARASRSVAFSGGKAANAAHVAALEGASATLVGFVGGERGKEFARGLKPRGIRGALVRAAAPTRRTFCFLDADGAQPVLVVEDGAKVTPREVAAFGVRVERELTRTDVLVLSGSVPPGMKPAVYAHWIRSARAHGIPSVVDAHGEALRAAITAVPTVIVPNEREFAQWLGLALFDGIDDRTLIDGARPLLERGMLAVVVKQGERGLLCIERERTTRVCGLPRLGNATGSGDVVTAHVAVALARGWPILVALPRAVAAAGANLAHEQPGHYREREVVELLGVVEVSGSGGDDEGRAART